MSIAKRILLVDDEEGVLFVLSNTLKKLGDGVEIVTAHNGWEAWRYAQASPFDLIITDLRMPVMDGVELTQAIRTLTADTTVIWMTAYGAHLRGAEVERLQVYRCLEKPLQVTEIRRVASEALENGYDKRTPAQKSA
jgi:DNA-binding NtrC family response regulator